MPSLLRGPHDKVSPSRPRDISPGWNAPVDVLVVGFAVSGWGSSGSSSPSTSKPLPHLAITFAADNNTEVQFLLSDVRPYVEPGDSFDLVSGSPEGKSSKDVSDHVNSWAQELRAVYPGHAIYAHTTELASFAAAAGGAGSNASGDLYDYEPNFQPELAFNFTQTFASFDNATAIAHLHGLLSIGYPTGRPVLVAEFQKSKWNHGTLGLAVARLVIQTQAYCTDGPSEFANATRTVLSRYAMAGVTSAPTFQITIGNSTTTLPNGVTAVPAYQCAQQLTDQGLHSLYLWWDEGGEWDLLVFLQDIGRN